MKIDKVLGGVLLILMTLNTVQAQEDELGLSLFGGVAGIKYENADLFGGNQFGFSVDYALRLDDNWSIVMGAMGGTYTTKIVKEGYSASYLTEDMEGESFEFRYRADRFEEKLSGNYIAVPVSFRFETVGRSNVQFYAQGGVKYSLNSKVTSKFEWDNLTTSGYFSKWDVELFKPEFLGFGVFPSISKEKKFELKDSFSVLGEVGIKQAVGRNNALYIGVFADYDLASEDSKDRQLITYQAQGDTPLEFHSAIEEIGSTKQRLNAFYLGLKLRYAFGL